MNFDPLSCRYPSRRYPITARNGMVCTGSNLASAAGLHILREGGNAIDAAAACAAALTVVEPTSNGLGSDNFAIVWVKDHIYGLNSSGPAPAGISIEKVKERYHTETMPPAGWAPVTVPGAPAGWAALVKRFGRLSLKEDLAPAIAYAEEGFFLPPCTAAVYEKDAEEYRRILGEDSRFAPWFRTFSKNGRAPRFGEMIRLPDHARTLRLIAESDGEAFYKGEIADAIVRQSRRDGGYFEKEDLACFKPSWVDPVSVNYRGYDVWEIPPNGQGIVALMALNILKEFDFPDDIYANESARTRHLQFEAMKMAFADGIHYITDPDYMKIDYHELLKPDYGRIRAGQITDRAGLPPALTLPGSDTVYMCTADGEGNMVSLIQSNYDGFGSGIVIDGYGIAMQNRGADFSLNPADANALAPGKRSYHTIIPGFLSRNSKAVGPFGVMGAYMQPQGHVQVLTNMLDFGMNPQQALDAPRWQWIRDRHFAVEDGFPREAARGLQAMGHEIHYNDPEAFFGRGQIIIRLDSGALVSGCEPRTDSCTACW